MGLVIKPDPMILHYLRIAFRNLERQKLLTFINISGLSIGLACFSLFLLYAVNEFSYDRFHVQAPNIYRVYNWWAYEGRAGSEPASTTPLGPALKNDFPDVLDFVRVQGGGEKLVRAGGDVLRINVSFADPQILSVFTFPLIAGNSATALRDMHNIVLTRATSLKLFGETNVVGKQVEIKTGDSYEVFTVGGVADDIPVNSTVQFDILGSFDHLLNTAMGKASNNDWNMTIGIAVYVHLHPSSNLMNDLEQLASFRKKYFPGEAAFLRKEGLWNGEGVYPNGYGLQRLADVHTGIKVDPWSAVDPKNVWILIGISASVLLIACINFIILAIGRSSGRSKEVGVRKIIGGQRKQLIFQFLSESFLLTLFSSILGIGIAQTLLPYFNELSGRNLHFAIDQYPDMFVFLAITVMAVGLLAGCYPALVLSGFKPVEALKNKVKLAGSNLFTRSLVTFQFVLSVSLIISTFVILRQLSFMRSKDLGISKENVVMISVQDAPVEGFYARFRDQLLSNTRVTGVTASAIGLGDGEGQMGRRYEVNGKDEGIIEYPVDHQFLPVMGMRLVAGRNFDPANTSDTSTSVVVNESLVKSLLNTTPSLAIGMQLKVPGGNSVPKTIIGVANDFHFENLTRNVRPQLFLNSRRFRPAVVFVRLRPGDPKEALSFLESSWRKAAPDSPFRYSFLDEKFDAFYKSEERWSGIVGWAGNISIFLACLGLFGLTSLAVANRTKEIGIRKVLGATAGRIARLICKDFVGLVLIAIVIAIPVSWYAMHEWLQHFAYKVPLDWWIFAITGLLAVLIAALTVGIQVIKAAMADPVKSLRSE